MIDISMNRHSSHALPESRYPCAVYVFNLKAGPVGRVVSLAESPGLMNDLRNVLSPSLRMRAADGRHPNYHYGWILVLQQHSQSWFNLGN